MVQTFIKIIIHPCWNYIFALSKYQRQQLSPSSLIFYGETLACNSQVFL